MANTASIAHPQTEHEKEELTFVVADSGGEPVHVLVHNDDVTPIDFVIIVLASIFELPWSRARAVTYVAHTAGVAHVATLPIEDAKFRVGQAHHAARLAGYPLSFSIEPV